MIPRKRYSLYHIPTARELMTNKGIARGTFSATENGGSAHTGVAAFSNRGIRK